eukprot:5747148-Pyramimonas_sp.AAC.1
MTRNIARPTRKPKHVPRSCPCRGIAPQLVDRPGDAAVAAAELEDIQIAGDIGVPPPPRAPTRGGAAGPRARGAS